MHPLTAFTWLHKHYVHGFHAFRRFRITWLRDFGTPENILRYWVGHQGFGMTDRYSKHAENAEVRKQWSERVGLGFDISLTGASPPHPRKSRKPRPFAEVATPPDETPKFQASDDDLSAELTPEPVQEEV